jgi:hypothetical protein
MRIQTCAIAIVMLSIIVASLYYGTLVVYGSSDENDDENDDEMSLAITLATKMGRNDSFNQTQQSDCSTTGQAQYEGFISGCVSPGEETILLAI